jgi:hypothetical protein
MVNLFSIKYKNLKNLRSHRCPLSKVSLVLLLGVLEPGAEYLSQRKEQMIPYL